MLRHFAIERRRHMPLVTRHKTQSVVAERIDYRLQPLAHATRRIDCGEKPHRGGAVGEVVKDGIS